MSTTAEDIKQIEEELLPKSYEYGRVDTPIWQAMLSTVRALRKAFPVPGERLPLDRGNEGDEPITLAVDEPITPAVATEMINGLNCRIANDTTRKRQLCDEIARLNAEITKLLANQCNCPRRP